MTRVTERLVWRPVFEERPTTHGDYLLAIHGWTDPVIQGSYGAGLFLTQHGTDVTALVDYWAPMPRGTKEVSS